MDDRTADDPAELVRSLAATLRFARWTGADVVDRAWSRPVEPVAQPAVPQPAAARPQRPPLPITAPPAAHDPVAALDKWRARATGCERCHHAKSRTQIVFSQGNPHAKLIVVGDAPGPLEDAAGQPFQGDAGLLLDKMLGAIGLTRAEVWLTTLTLCRPPLDGVVSAEAIVACSPYLRTQIEAIRPHAVLLMGEAAAQFLFRQQKPLGELRGQWQRVLDRPTLATWPPAALLENPTKKREAWADLQQIQKRLQEA